MSKISLFLISSLVLVLFSCGDPCDLIYCPSGYVCIDGDCIKSDPCVSLNCLNGGICLNGTCDCPEGYTGQYCQIEIQPPVSEPTGYVIKRIQIQNMPQCYSNGNPIDVSPDDPQPDIKVKIVHSSVTYSSGIDYGANQVDFDNLNWVVNSTSGNSALKIYDMDNLGAVSVEELLMNISFNFSMLENDSDNALSIQINEYFSSSCYPGNSPSWVRLYFDIIE